MTRSHLNPSDWPCSTQSEKSIRRWLRGNIKVGALVAIRRTHGGTVEYERGLVVSVRPKNFNVAPHEKDATLAEAGETFDYSGRRWRDPDGPIRLVIPTPAILAWIADRVRNA